MENDDLGIDYLVEGDNTELEGKYLTFLTGEQLFGIPIARVVQIVGILDITPVPDYPVYIKGVINLRGSIVPVIDIRLRTGKPEREYDDHTCIILIDTGRHSFGLIVDEVDEVTAIDNEYISEPPQVSSDYVNRYLTGIARLEGKIVLLIDAGKILSDDEMELLEKKEV